MWSAIPVALLCMVVNWNERKQGSGPKVHEVLLSTGGLSLVHLLIHPSVHRQSPQALSGLKFALLCLKSALSGFELALLSLKSALSGLKSVFSELKYVLPAPGQNKPSQTSNQLSQASGLWMEG